MKEEGDIIKNNKEYFDLINQLPLSIKILYLNNNIVFFNNYFIMEYASYLDIKRITLDKYLSSIVNRVTLYIITFL